MQTFSFPDPFAAKRPSFAFNTLLLLALMLLYPLVGAALFSLVAGELQLNELLSNPNSRLVPMLRTIQSLGQIVVLALPVLLLAAWHTRSKQPFSRNTLAFLGIRPHLDLGTAALAVAGIFLLQPLLYTITSLQDSYLWPSLGEAGAEVVRQRKAMEGLITALAHVGSISEFFQVAFVLAVTPALCEELLFRGYIQQNYTRSMSSGNAVFWTGCVFAFFHLSAANLIPLALLGWYIGYIYSRTGNLAIPVVAHLMNNLAALLALMLGYDQDTASASQVHAFVVTPLWWLLVFVCLLLFVMVVRRFAAVQASAHNGV